MCACIYTCRHISAGVLGDQRHGIPLEVVHCSVWMLNLDPLQEQLVPLGLSQLSSHPGLFEVLFKCDLPATHAEISLPVTKRLPGLTGMFIKKKETGLSDYSEC